MLITVSQRSRCNSQIAFSVQQTLQNPTLFNFHVYKKTLNLTETNKHFVFLEFKGNCDYLNNQLKASALEFFSGSFLAASLCSYADMVGPKLRVTQLMSTHGKMASTPLE